LINAEKVELSHVYDKSLQDQFALRLLKDAGWNKFEDGLMSLQRSWNAWQAFGQGFHYQMENPLMMGLRETGQS
jgi:predicted oxidoreductase (fatty acid repression mutant protein)